VREPDPQLRDDDIDRRFAEIVAGWHLTGAQSERNAALAKGVESTALDDPSAEQEPTDSARLPIVSGEDGPDADPAMASSSEANDHGPEENSSAAASPPIISDANSPGDRGDGDTHARASETDTEAAGADGQGTGLSGLESRRGPINPPLFERRPIRRTPPAAPNFPVWRGATNEAPYDEILDQVEDEDHFEPPEPRPLPPQEDLHFWGIIVGLVGGPLLLLWLVLFRPDVAGWWMWLAIAMSLGGFVLLVLRGSSDDDHDNGAVV